MILTFYNLILQSQMEDDQRQTLVLEINIIPINSTSEGFENRDNQLNLSLLTHIIDLLFHHINLFKLAEFTSTIAECLYLIQKLIDYSGVTNSSSKTVYTYITRLIDADIQSKNKTDTPLYYFGEDDIKSKSHKTECYLRYVFHTMEILPSSEPQSDTSLVSLLSKVIDRYNMTKFYQKLMDSVIFESFLVVLSRIEVNLMSMQLVDDVFVLFEHCTPLYPTNTNMLF